MEPNQHQFVANEVVYSPGGEELGSIARVLAEPDARRITAVTVLAGRLRSRERVVAVELVHKQNGHSLLLLTPAELSRQPLFDEAAYREATAEDAPPSPAMPGLAHLWLRKEPPGSGESAEQSPGSADQSSN